MYSIRVDGAAGCGRAGNGGDLSSSQAIRFSAGNPRVEHLVGKVHLYRELERGRDRDADRGAEHEPVVGAGEGDRDPEQQRPSSSDRICILGLPPRMGFSELCTYLGGSYDHVTEIRLVRREGHSAHAQDGECDGGGVQGAEAHTGSLLVLLSFDGVASAEAFHREFHDTPFCLLEPEFVCKLLFVKDVELIDVDIDTGGDAGVGDGGGDGGRVERVERVERAEHVESVLQGCEQPRVELPSCPVCLDRLEPSASGIVTTVCNHRFHNQCLRQWVDSSCPVCRYVQGGDCGDASGASASGLPQECAHDACHSTVDLWMCLICGHTGCGRYRGSHAAKHFEETGHGFALELADGGQRGGRPRRSELVWDYMRDAYVHRVVNDELFCDPAGQREDAGDGHGIDHDPGHGRGRGRDGGFAKATGAVDSALMQSKVDTITTELTQLMVSQMETQREYYQKIVQSHHLATEKALADTNASASVAHAASAAADAAAQRAEHATRVVQRKNQDLVEKLEKARKELGFLRELNDTLLSDTKGWRERVAKVEGERDGLKADVAELNDQVTDLMMFIEARDAIEKGGCGEAVGGSVGVVARRGRKTKTTGRR